MGSETPFLADTARFCSTAVSLSSMGDRFWALPVEEDAFVAGVGPFKRAERFLPREDPRRRMMLTQSMLTEGNLLRMDCRGESMRIPGERTMQVGRDEAMLYLMYLQPEIDRQLYRPSFAFRMAVPFTPTPIRRPR